MAIILPSGFVITNNEPVDSRLSVADSASRLSLSVNNVYEGITVYQRDTNILYVLTDANAPSSNSSWQSLISNTSSSIAVSASYSATSSYALSGFGLFSGSFSGSFQGNGFGLTNIPASGIVGLTLFQITSGSATASISPNNGFIINTNTTITSSDANIFLIKNAAGFNMLTVSQSGVIVIATQSVELTGHAPAGGMYFTSGSFFVGLEM